MPPSFSPIRILMPPIFKASNLEISEMSSQLMVLNCVFAFHLLSPWSLVIALESNVNCINLFLLAIIVSSKRCRYALPSSISYGSKRGFPLLSNSLTIQFGFLSSGYGLKGILIRSSIEVDLEQNYIVHTYKTADNGNRCRQDLLPNKCLLTPQKWTEQRDDKCLP